MLLKGWEVVMWDTQYFFNTNLWGTSWIKKGPGARPKFKKLYKLPNIHCFNYFCCSSLTLSEKLNGRKNAEVWAAEVYPTPNSVPFLFNFRTRELKRTFLSGSQDTRGAKPTGSGKGYKITWPSPQYCCGRHCSCKCCNSPIFSNCTFCGLKRFLYFCCCRLCNTPTALLACFVHMKVLSIFWKSCN